MEYQWRVNAEGVVSLTTESPAIYRLPPNVIWTISTFLRDEHTTDGLRALASLARTCRLFSGPTLDALWSIIPSIVPLLRVLPRSLCTYSPEIRTPKGDIVRPPCLVLRRFPQSQDFQRLRVYACRIRQLHLPVYHSYPLAFRERYLEHRTLVADSVWSALRSVGPSPLLPNLVSLRHVGPRHISTQDRIDALIYVLNSRCLAVKHLHIIAIPSAHRDAEIATTL
ncbi:hypothetical protein C8Q79DRAFT_314274 [Trametes meyenii]|nr:hypothetical protein C8Q79DRAFT_314274 [Trametes meyenii]